MRFFRNLTNSGVIVTNAILTLVLIGNAAAQQSGNGQAATSTPSQPTASIPSQPAATPQASSDNSAKTDSTPSWQTKGVPSGLDKKTLEPKYAAVQEDWSSLQVGISNLVPQRPLVAETDDGKTFTRQLVQLQWRPGDPIDLYVILPKGVKRPPAVLYLYDYSENTDRFRSNDWCATVTGEGVAAVGFVSALSGPRFHDRPMKQWFVSELQESLGSTVHDVKFILDYLASRGDIDTNRIGMFGQASGGTIAILAAAADPRIKAVDALDPWGDWPDWLAKSMVVTSYSDSGEYVKTDFLKRVAPLDPVKWLPELTTTKIRIQQVGDWGNPIESQDKIQQAAPKQAEVDRFATAVVLGKREGHGVLFDWIASQLKAIPETGVVKASAVPVQPNGAPAQAK
jgi:hypothetical protein